MHSHAQISDGRTTRRYANMRRSAKEAVVRAELPLLRAHVDHAFELTIAGLCVRCVAAALKREVAARRDAAAPETEKLSKAAEEIRTLQDQLLVAQEALYLKRSWRAPEMWRLTQSEEIVVGVLIAREYPAESAFLAALYSDQLEQPDAKIIDVYICKARAKVRRFGVTIKTHWGRGYYLPADQRAALKAGAERIEAAA